MDKNITIIDKDYSQWVKELVTRYRQRQIIQLIQNTPHVTQIEMARKLNVSRQTIYRDITYLASIEIIVREGSNKKGYWIIADLQ